MTVGSERVEAFSALLNQAGARVTCRVLSTDEDPNIDLPNSAHCEGTIGEHRVTINYSAGINESYMAIRDETVEVHNGPPEELVAVATAWLAKHAKKATRPRARA